MDWGLWGFPSFWTRQSQVHARWSHLLPGFWAHGSCSCPHHGGLRWWHQIGGVTELDGLSTFHAGGGMCSWSCETRLGRLKMLKVKGLTFRWIFVVQPIKSEWNILMKTHEYWYIHISPIEDWWVVFFSMMWQFPWKGKVITGGKQIHQQKPGMIHGLVQMVHVRRTQSWSWVFVHEFLGGPFGGMGIMMRLVVARFSWDVFSVLKRDVFKEILLLIEKTTNPANQLICSWRWCSISSINSIFQLRGTCWMACYFQ